MGALEQLPSMLTASPLTSPADEMLMEMGFAPHLGLVIVPLPPASVTRSVTGYTIVVAPA